MEKEPNKIEEPHVVISQEDARQGVRVKGMTTVLTVSILVSVVLLTIIVIYSARG